MLFQPNFFVGFVQTLGVDRLAGERTLPGRARVPRRRFSLRERILAPAAAERPLRHRGAGHRSVSLPKKKLTL